VLRPFARTSPRIARLDMTDNWRVLTAYEVLSQLPADPDDAMSVVAIVTKSIKKALPASPAGLAGDHRERHHVDTPVRHQGRTGAVFAIVMDAIEKISRPYARTSSPKPPTKPTG